MRRAARKKVLLVEDDVDLAELYRGVLRWSGFDAAHVLTFQQSVPGRLQTAGARLTFLDDLMTRLKAAPGVTS